MDEDHVALMGAPGSPYTRKMLAVLRYRRIPYRYLTAAQAAAEGMPVPRVPLLPTFYLPGDAGALEAVTDSTPLIRRFEAERPGRSVIPTDPALAFIDELIEDYADEWLTKPMFHYRWTRAADIDRAGRILPLWRNQQIDDDTLEGLAASISERQISRLGFVGSNPVTGPIIEAGYQRFLAALEAHLVLQPFLLGRRPGAGDFAVFGQLSQLAMFDPTPMELSLRVAPRVFAWASLMDDRSGLEPQHDDWVSLGAAPATLKGILSEIGRVYPPVMLANARALAEGAGEVEAEVDGRPWRQAPFPYQAKCLRWLRESYSRLASDARAQVDALLAGTGCENLIA
ncbi:MAG TPA: glutathione S-transferase family protein [Caulobacteraceae bacterium]|jgi:glutathione S-transferase|nr:glutathione S-transferase family protein [Caulobacteraceae bacterium]